MEDCAVVMPREGCCTKCKGCWYNGTEHASHTEWSEEEKVLRCEAGVVTISRPECYAPCERPKHQRHIHYNCPVCDGKFIFRLFVISRYRHWSAGWFSGSRSRLRNQRSRVQTPVVSRGFCDEKLHMLMSRDCLSVI
jgi:hypothetical protein